MAFFDFEDKKVYSEIHGESGEPLLILNGIMMSTNSWRPMLKNLSKNNVAILVDFLDQGQSSRMTEGYTHAIQVRLLDALLDILPYEKVSIMGISYGGEVAIQYAVEHPERVRRLMRSYARNQGGQVPDTALAQDIAANDETPISEETVASYVNALRKIFVVEDMPAWNPNLRSKTAIRSSDTRYYIDPSIAAAALGIGPSDLLNDLKTIGFLFETLCIRDLRVFADALNGGVYHYRDKDGQECDAVIHLRNGKYGLVEIKLGGDSLIEEGAKSLKAMEAKIDTDKMNKPSFLMVLTGTGDYAYCRQDGVYVVPIGCLKD